ncbi:hypothetical protein RIF29_04082 [Crotalaria pallida]|uniref:Reverse transcriptase zinc-binding domain-containing protein n=1 Tax=Crotalaria pallida TaxID=3830 RepID=A0AAN9J218_CROPI
MEATSAWQLGKQYLEEFLLCSCPFVFAVWDSFYAWVGVQHPNSASFEEFLSMHRLVFKGKGPRRYGALLFGYDGEWNFQFLENILPSHISNKIRAIPHPDEDSGPDRLIWSTDDSGSFSIKSAYSLLANEKAWVPHMPWVTIWNWKGPEKYKFHFWKCSHDRLLTNKRKSSWGLSSSDCPFCPGLAKDSLHVMRDCYMAAQVWNCFVPYSELANFFSQDLYSWLRSNIQTSKIMKLIPSWLDFFFSILYLLWYWRNKYVAEGVSFSLEEKCKFVSNVTKEINLYSGCSKEEEVKRKITINICWLPPPLSLDGGARKDQIHINRFREVLDECGLEEVEVGGNPFTWGRKNRQGQFVRERLDRLIVSLSWRNIMQKCLVSHLSAPVSDHVPILMYFEFVQQRRRLKDNSGRSLKEVAGKLHLTSLNLADWSKKEIPSIPKELKQLQIELDKAGYDNSVC